MQVVEDAPSDDRLVTCYDDLEESWSGTLGPFDSSDPAAASFNYFAILMVVRILASPSQSKGCRSAVS